MAQTTDTVNKLAERIAIRLAADRCLKQQQSKSHLGSRRTQKKQNREPKQSQAELQQKHLFSENFRKKNTLSI